MEQNLALVQDSLHEIQSLSLKEAIKEAMGKYQNDILLPLYPLLSRLVETGANNLKAAILKVEVDLFSYINTIDLVIQRLGFPRATNLHKKIKSLELFAYPLVDLIASIKVGLNTQAKHIFICAGSKHTNNIERLLFKGGFNYVAGDCGVGYHHGNVSLKTDDGESFYAVNIHDFYKEKSIQEYIDC